MEIAKGYNQELVSEVALRCNDIEFRDFRKDLYGQACYREEKSLATEYSIFDRLYVIKIEQDNEETIIPLANFRAEYRVEINDVLFTKVNDIVLPNSNKVVVSTEYIIKYQDNKLTLEYQDKKKGDIVKIFYISLGNTGEEYDGTILVPTKYYEELLRRVCLHISKLGIAKFTAEKKQKYADIYKLYSRIGKDVSLSPDLQWVSIKPFKYI